MSTQGQHRERAHPTPIQYAKVALALAVITAVEVSAFYVEALDDIIVAVFIVLSVVKFALVVMFYMHLRYDSRLFSGLFLGGLFIATAVIISLMGLFQVLLESPAPAVAETEITGEKVFLGKGCAACHTIEGLSTGAIGPKLDGIGTSAHVHTQGMSAEEYIRQSIEKPGAYVVEGFPNAMPADIRASMTDKEFEALVSFLLTK